MSLALSGWRKLAPLRRQFELKGGFLFVPVLVTDEAVAIAAKHSLADAWRARARVWHELAWPTIKFDAENPAEFRASWLEHFDQAVTRSSENDTLVVDASDEPAPHGRRHQARIDTRRGR